MRTAYETMLAHRYGADFSQEDLDKLLVIGNEIAKYVQRIWVFFQAEAMVSSGVDRNGQPWVTVDISSNAPEAVILDFLAQIMAQFGVEAPISWTMDPENPRRIRLMVTRKPTVP
jgi:hypothetical protein